MLLGCTQLFRPVQNISFAFVRGFLRNFPVELFEQLIHKLHENDHGHFTFRCGKFFLRASLGCWFLQSQGAIVVMALYLERSLRGLFHYGGKDKH